MPSDAATRAARADRVQAILSFLATHARPVETADIGKAIGLDIAVYAERTRLWSSLTTMLGQKFVIKSWSKRVITGTVHRKRRTRKCRVALWLLTPKTRKAERLVSRPEAQARYHIAPGTVSEWVRTRRLVARGRRQEGCVWVKLYRVADLLRLKAAFKNPADLKPPRGHLTVEGAAAVIGVNRYHVRDLHHQGKLEGTRVRISPRRFRVFVLRKSAEAYAEARRKNGAGPGPLVDLAPEPLSERLREWDQAGRENRLSLWRRRNPVAVAERGM